MGMYLKTQPFCPKLSKFSNVKVPATTTWHVTAWKAWLTLWDVSSTISQLDLHPSPLSNRLQNLQRFKILNPQRGASPHRGVLRKTKPWGLAASPHPIATSPHVRETLRVTSAGSGSAHHLWAIENL